MAFPDGWNRVCEVLVKGSTPGEVGVAEQVVLVLTADSLPAEMLDPTSGNACQADGGDIRVASVKNGVTESHLLPIELIEIVQDATPANQRAEIWVRPPLLSTVTDTSLFVFYKSDSGTETQPARDALNVGSENVWPDYDLALNFAGTDVPSTVDSTPNRRDATNSEGSVGFQTTGKFGTGSAVTVGSGIGIHRIPGTGPDWIDAYPWTIETMTRLARNNVRQMVAVTSSGQGRRLQAAHYDENINGGTYFSHQAQIAGGGLIGDWSYYATGSRPNDSWARADYDRAVSLNNTGNQSITDTIDEWLVGRPQTTRYGLDIDFLHWSTKDLGDGWIQTRERCFNHPDSFYSVGVPEDVGGAPPGTWVGAGVLTAEEASIAGVGLRFSTITGVGDVQAEDAAISGAGLAFEFLEGGGNVQADDAVIQGVGVGYTLNTGVGALQGEDATITGVGEAGSLKAGAAALQAEDAVIQGDGVVVRVGSGQLQADDALIQADGTTLGIESGTGALQADDAAIAGDGLIISKGAGDLRADDAILSAVGFAFTPGGETTLTAQDLLNIQEAVWSDPRAVKLIAQINEIWQRRGLDPDNPHVLDKGNGLITVGGVTIDVAGDASKVTQTRRP